MLLKPDKQRVKKRWKGDQFKRIFRQSSFTDIEGGVSQNFAFNTSSLKEERFSWGFFQFVLAGMGLLVQTGLETVFQSFQFLLLGGKWLFHSSQGRWALGLGVVVSVGMFGYSQYLNRVNFIRSAQQSILINNLLDKALSNPLQEFVQINETLQDFPVQAPFSDASLLPAVEFHSYVVEPGDTVSAIAYKTDLSLDTILGVNQIRNVKRLQVGHQLRLPSMDGLIHTVKKHDTLLNIAKSYAIPVNHILDANDLASTTIVERQELFIPYAKMDSIELRKILGELFIYPAKGYISSGYGYRIDPISHIRKFHTGVDIAAPSNTAVIAAMDGRVITSEFNPVFGHYVIIEHDRQLKTLYAHLLRPGARRGTYVAQGETIGRMGSTGYSTGSHLHFSVIERGKYVNPMQYLH